MVSAAVDGQQVVAQFSRICSNRHMPTAYHARQSAAGCMFGPQVLVVVAVGTSRSRSRAAWGRWRERPAGAREVDRFRDGMS